MALLSVTVLLLSAINPALAAGETGSITIQGNESVSLAGSSFRAYKILDVTLNTSVEPATPSYTVPAALQDFYTSYLSIESSYGTAAYDQEVSSKILSLTAGDMEAFAKAALTAAKAASIEAKEATGSGPPDNSATFSNIPLGYYVIEDMTTVWDFNVISAVMVDTTQPAVAIEIKATLPTIDKKILDPDPVTANEASIGDTLTFLLTSHVPDMTGYNRYYFMVNDTLGTGFTYGDIASVKVGGQTLSETDYTVETDVNANGETMLRIIFHDFLQYKPLKGETVQISYTADLNDSALIGEANINKTWITYSNNPAYDYEANKDPERPDDPVGSDNSPTGTTVVSSSETFTTALTITKKDSKNNEILAGAAFRIEGNGVNQVVTTGIVFVEDLTGTYYKLLDGTYTETAPDAENGHLYDGGGLTTYILETTATIDAGQDGVEAEAFVDDCGKLTFAGLGAGTYTLTEIVTPDGFNSIDPIEFTIGFDADNRAFLATPDGSLVENDNELFMTIINTAGQLLPSTGGIGTTIFYVLGSVLVAGTLIFFVSKKSASDEKSK